MVSLPLLLATALAAPVQCDPVAAARMLSEARIDEDGASRTHPWLVPGLALASPQTDDALRTPLEALCAEGGELSVSSLADWDTSAWSAHSLRLTRSETRDCVLVEQSIAITVGTEPGTAPRYGLQATLPLSQTPLGECDTPARWRDETVIAGEEGPVRLVLGLVREGEAVVASQILVRRATPTGWHEQVLAEPAPGHLRGETGGRQWFLKQTEAGWLVVAGPGTQHGEQGCTPIRGQRAWTWDEDHWEAHEGADARELLARQGEWRFAGDAGWVVILAQDTEDDRDLLESRRRRLSRKRDGTLLILESATFPELNAGYLIVTPPPFATEADAQAERLQWGRRSTSYVKRAWPEPAPCPETGP